MFSNNCWKFSLALTGINYILKYIQIEVLQQYSKTNLINAALVQKYSGNNESIKAKAT